MTTSGVTGHHRNSTGIQPCVAEEARSPQMWPGISGISPQSTDRLHGWKFRSQSASENKKHGTETRENSAESGLRSNSFPGWYEHKLLAAYPSPVTPELFKHLDDEGKRWYEAQCRKAFQVRVNMIAAMVPCTKEVAKTALHGMGDNMDWAYVKARHIQDRVMTCRYESTHGPGRHMQPHFKVPGINNKPRLASGIRQKKCAEQSRSASEM